MRKFLFALAVGLLATPASAVVLQIDFSAATTGAPNPAIGSVTINNPFNATVIDSAAGLTVNALNFDVDSPVVFTYRSSDRFLFIHSGDPVVNDDDDFILSVPLESGFLRSLTLAQSGQGFIADDANASATVTELSTIPLPAGLPLLLGGLGVLGLAARLGR